MKKLVGGLMCVLAVGLANATSSEDITELTETCCNWAEEVSVTSASLETCAAEQLPDYMEYGPGQEAICRKAMESCCKEQFKIKDDCTAGLKLAPAKRCTDTSSEIGKTCCDECSFGRSTGESQSKRACGAPPNGGGVSLSFYLTKQAYHKCCLEAAEEQETTTEKKVQTTRAPVKERCKEGSCAHNCDDTTGVVRCSCKEGFRLQPDKKSCNDINECAESLDDLCTAEDTVCHNTPGAFKCVPIKKRDVSLSCPPGFKRNVQNQVCDDINECQLPRPPCPKYLCENTIGGYKCGGKPGKPFEEFVPGNAPVPRVTDPEPNATPKNDICPPGFRAGDDDECNDIDECKENADDCQRLSQHCINTHGGFFCQDHVSKRCAPGFKVNKDTGICEDIDECEESSEVCRKTEVCVNLPGAYNCKSKISQLPKLTPKNCQEGTRFKVGGKTCEDIDECREGTHLCDQFQNCINTFGAHECRCKSGFELDSSSGSCVDIDECALKLDNCGPGRHCLNVMGSFTCTREAATTTTPGPEYEYEYYDEDEDNSTDPEPNNERNPPPQPPKPATTSTTTTTTTSTTTTPKPTPRPKPTRRPYTPYRPDDRRPNPQPTPPEDKIPVLPPKPTDAEDTEEKPRPENRTKPVYNPYGPSRPVDPRRPDPRRPETPAKPEDPIDNDPRQPDYPSRPTYSNRPDYPSRPTEPRRPDSTRPRPEYPSRPTEPSRPNPDYPSSPSRPDSTRPVYPSTPTDPSRPNPDYPSSPSRPDSTRPVYPSTPTDPSRPNQDYPSSRPDYPTQPESTRPDSSSRPTDPSRPEPSQPDSTRPDSPTRPISSGRPSYPTRPEPSSRPDSPTRPDSPRRPETPRRQPGRKPPRRTTTTEVPTTTVVAPGFDPTSVHCLYGFQRDEYGNCVEIQTSVSNDLLCLTGFEKDRYGNCADVNECEKGQHICSSLENCINRVGGYTCECLSGFRRSDDGWCMAIITTTSTTTSTSTTTERPSPNAGSLPDWPYQPFTPRPTTSREDRMYPLPCELGFVYDPLQETCVDIDECTEQKDTCSKTEDCVNLDGGFRCVCGRRCRAENERPSFAPVEPPRQPDSGSNVITVGSQYGQRGSWSPRPTFTRTVSGDIVTSCPWGYKLTPERRCYDVDECARNISSCGPQQRCENFYGGYSCQCPAGHKLAGQNQCEDIDECVHGNPCSYNSRCINTIGSYRCECSDGFRNAPFNDKVCADIDECTETPNVCEQSCANVWGGYRCHCKRGYRLATDNSTCVDINECAEYSGSLGRGKVCGGECVNEPGSYRCRCPRGYRLSDDQKSCIDIDECESGEASCAGTSDPGQVCQNTRGSYHCHQIDCPHGYRLESKHRCTRIQRSCSISDWACLQQPGSYSYNFITFVSHIYIPSGSVDLFTMHGPSWSDSVFSFEMKMVRVQASPGVSPTDLRCFDMRPSNNVCVISLLCSLDGPQVAELELSMSLYQRGMFAGSTVARLVVIVSEYEF